MVWDRRIDVLRIKLAFPSELFERAVCPVIRVYGDFVRRHSPSQCQDPADLGALLDNAIEVAGLALDFRRGQIFPPSAAPEAIGERAHRWTYAVFLAALLHDVRKHVAGLPGRNVGDDQLLRSFVPAEIVEWLAIDADLMHELSAFLCGDGTVHGGAIGGLVHRAQIQAMRRNNVRLTLCPFPPGELVDIHPAIEKTECFEHFGSKRNEVTREKPQLRPTPEAVPLVLTSLPRVPLPAIADAESASDAAIRFRDWLKAGLAEGAIRFNEAAAWVHFVEEGMLLVSPRIFKEFAMRFGEDGRGGAVAVEVAGVEPGKAIQRQVLRAGWHVRTAGGVNILTYQVTRGGRAKSRLCGVVIRNPSRFVNPVPPTNPVLVRLPPKTIED